MGAGAVPPGNIISRPSGYTTLHNAMSLPNIQRSFVAMAEPSRRRLVRARGLINQRGCSNDVDAKRKQARADAPACF
jgi:hypothetical protein